MNGSNEMVGKEKIRILLTLPLYLKDNMTNDAKEANRNLNNYIVTLLLKRDK
jgi:hypothetical protein